MEINYFTERVLMFLKGNHFKFNENGLNTVRKEKMALFSMDICWALLSMDICRRGNGRSWGTQ